MLKKKDAKKTHVATISLRRLDFGTRPNSQEDVAPKRRTSPASGARRNRG